MGCGFFYVPHLLQYGTSVYTVSSQGPVPMSHNGFEPSVLYATDLSAAPSERDGVQVFHGEIEITYWKINIIRRVTYREVNIMQRVPSWEVNIIQILTYWEVNIVSAANILTSPATRSPYDIQWLTVSVKNSNVGFPFRSSGNQKQ
jgi:hypothetical protein